MILTAKDLDVYDRCPRRFAYERTHEPRTITTLGLLYAAVEAGLTSEDPCQGAKDAIAERTSWMDINAGDLSPISAVKHIECMGEVISLALREKLGRAKRVKPQPVGEHEWRSNLFVFNGQLHRIILTSHMDDDSIRSFAHSWLTIGELAALEHSLHLTAIIIGAQRGGRRHSPWSKGFIHPIQKTLRIGRRKAQGADGFTAGWKDCWREQTDIKAETWLQRMKTDEVLDDLITSRRIRHRAEDERMIQAKRELLILADQMSSATVDAPMRRSSCDDMLRGPCPWAALDYSVMATAPEHRPDLYREKPREAPTPETPLVHIAGHTP